MPKKDHFGLAEVAMPQWRFWQHHTPTYTNANWFSEMHKGFLWFHATLKPTWQRVIPRGYKAVVSSPCSRIGESTLQGSDLHRYERITEKQLCFSKPPHFLRVSAAGNLSLVNLITQGVLVLRQRRRRKGNQMERENKGTVFQRIRKKV